MSDYIGSLFQRKYKEQSVHICLPGVSIWLNHLIELIFPIMGQQFFETDQELLEAFGANRERLVDILECQEEAKGKDIELIIESFYDCIESLEEQLNRDAAFFYECDPACQSVDEVIAAYPGFYAICCYRIAHYFYQQGFGLVARMITENAHSRTGVDIHPGASIGCPFFIDHATGVVVGETTVIGDRVVLYQGVTLGALRVTKDLLGVKRHPTVEDDCVIYAGATILGGDTVIGKKSIIGGNVWLSSSVKPNSFVYHESIMTTKERASDMTKSD
jgi:serine O-acetyltransferase